MREETCLPERRKDGRAFRMYLSGPIQGLSEAAWRPPFQAAARFWRERGWQVFSPEETPREGKEQWAWEDWLRYDLKQLADCDALCIVVSYFCRSQGMALELDVALRLGMRIYTTAGWN